MRHRRYPTVRDAHLGNDGDTIRLDGGRRTFTLSVLDGGPNDHGHVALIPNASVIQAAHYGDLGRPEVVHDLAYGGAIHVPGFGCMKIVRDGHNPDWPRLVPLDGDRFYARYDGGPGYLAWSIHDRDADGQRVLSDAVRDACMAMFNQPRPQNRAQAFAAASYLSATAEG